MRGNAPDKSKNMFARGRVKCCIARVSLGKVNRPTMFFYLAVATRLLLPETKSGANIFA